MLFKNSLESDDLISLHNNAYKKYRTSYISFGKDCLETGQLISHHIYFLSYFLIDDEIRKYALGYMMGIYPKEISDILDLIKGKTIITNHGKVFKKGLLNNCPKYLYRFVKRYLRDIENECFDYMVLRNKKVITSLYCRCKVKPGNDHVRAVIFAEGEVNYNSLYAAFTRSLDFSYEDKLKFILENKIPLRSVFRSLKDIQEDDLFNIIRHCDVFDILNNYYLFKCSDEIHLYVKNKIFHLYRNPYQ